MKKLIYIVFLSILAFLSFLCSVSYSQLSGTYTIGAGENYLTISAAVNDLNSNGVNGPVIFDIKSGSYDEFFTINSFTGSSTVNNVTFRSQSGNAADVIIHTSFLNTFLIKMNGADNVSFRDLTFTSFSGSSSQRNRIIFFGDCENVNITGCIFSGGTIDAGVASGGSDMHHMFIDQCNFSTYRGIQMMDELHVSESTIISNSTFNCTYGIALYYHHSLTIEKNVLSGIPVIAYPASYCIYLASCNGNIKVLKNKMYGGPGVIDGFKIDPFTGTSALIANNTVSINSGTCMYIGDCINMKIVYNTLKCISTSSGNVALINDNNVTLKNNIFVQLADFGTTTLTYYVSNSSVISDYNNFYHLSQYLLFHYNYGYVSSLLQYKTLSGQESNSVSVPVQFVSNNDLHLAGISLHDTELIGTPLTEVTDDIDGQPRNPLYPYMGADEADFPLPVELASFSSSVNGRNVTLNWSTFSELNNSGFDIERINVISQKSDVWTKVGFINGHGTTNSMNHYSYNDRDLNIGKYNYRLKQIDLNGSFEYYNLSNEVVIGVPEIYSLSQNYPNPFNPVTHLGFGISNPGFVSLKVYDILGNEIKTLVNEIKPAGYYEVEFKGSDLSSGIYYYSMEAGSFIETKRMIFLK